MEGQVVVEALRASEANDADVFGACLTSRAIVNVPQVVSTTAV